MKAYDQNIKTLTLPKKEYGRQKVKNQNIYQKAWDHLERAGEKVRVYWKTKKSSGEILQDERRR